MKRRQEGAVLLVVTLLLATIAALAFGMNRAGDTAARSVQDDYEGRAAGYLAEAGLAAAKWTNEVAGCTSSAVPRTPLGPGEFAAAVTKGASKRLNVVATGTVNGDAVRTIERSQVNIVDFRKPEQVDLAGDAFDTTIDVLAPLPDSGNTRLTLISNQSHALLYWPVTGIKPDAQVLSATLTLVQDGASATARQVALQRMTTRWDGNATWLAARAFVGWTGDDVARTVLASSAVADGASASWDVTGLVDGWASGRLLNVGMRLSLPDPGQSVVFFSRDAAANRRPLLRVVSAPSC